MGEPQVFNEFNPEHGESELNDPARIAAWLARDDLRATQIRGVFSAVPSAIAADTLALLGVDRAADSVRLLPVEQAAGLLSHIPSPRAAQILAQLPSDERADVLAALEPPAREAIADLLPEPMRAEAARLLRYRPDTAGGLMETELIAKPGSTTVGEVISDLRANQQSYAELKVQYLYIVDDSRRLLGVAPLRDLVLAPEDAPLASFVTSRPVAVSDAASTQELADIFDLHPYQGVPVVDAQGTLLGTVNRADVLESEQHQSDERYRRSQGIVGGEELRSMPVVQRLRRRGAWLGVNFVLSLGGAAVIAAFQDTLAKAIVVAAVLPIISAASGNAAMQAAAVSVRELTLGVVRAAGWRRVLAQELPLAVMLAGLLGVTVGTLSALWGAGWTLGIAVGAAMAINGALAVVLGALCPLLLRRWKIDPALASGPVTTTLSDISGFALTLAFVTLTR